VCSSDLLTTPSPSLFSFALAVGSSTLASDSNVDYSEKLDYASIKVGDLLKITFPWDQQWEPWESSNFQELDKSLVDRDGNRKILRRAVVVGTLLSKTEVNKSITSISFEISGEIETFALHLPKVRNGEIKFASVPQGTPHGRLLQRIPDVKTGTDRWKFFMSQNHPQFAFFGDGNYMNALGKYEYFESELCGLILGGLDRLPALDAARLDKLSEDKALHFINAYDQISRFPKKNTEAFTSLEMMNAVVLVGNRAIDLLTKKSSISQKLQIGLLNTGDTYMQEQALQSFSTSASYFEPVSDFASELNWEPPTGIKIWGWT
jgi:hypothetical protein